MLEQVFNINVYGKYGAFLEYFANAAGAVTSRGGGGRQPITRLSRLF